MPKRPCAIALTMDDSMILCADKFGDVYLLPLMGQTIESAAPEDDVHKESLSKVDGASHSSFVPSASSLTVHTKGNREALRQQQKIAKPKGVRKFLSFDHQLLLGHVSLLTDVVCVSVASSLGQTREYILTSDRDEHIRVSRGSSQTHVIEGFCLGHTEFISKLCIPHVRPDLLISGGGDDYLLAWDWLSGTIRQKVDLRSHVNLLKQHYHTNVALKNPVNLQEPADDSRKTGNQIAVTNIIAIETRAQSSIIVTCEG